MAKKKIEKTVEVIEEAKEAPVAEVIETVKPKMYRERPIIKR